MTTRQIPAIDRTPAVAALVAYLGLILLFARAHADEARSSRVPRAHVVTLVRGGLLLAVAQLAAVRDAGVLALLVCAALALLALILDGVDGHLARKDGTASRFGAWFDQELDAALVLVLSIVVWRADIAGAWVLLAGAWRYAFLGLRALSPRFRGELPPSQVRRVVCVVTISALLAVLTPLLGPSAKVQLLLAAVGVLSWSFTTDLVRLWSTTRTPDAHPNPAQR